jgi:ATP-dependent helicase/nuclease subunit B
MQFYYLDSSQNYLHNISKWLVANYINSLDGLKIFLPSGICCQFLNRYLLEHLSDTFGNQNFLLPSLLPLSTIADNFIAQRRKDELYLQASKTDELLALTQIISHKQQLNMTEALNVTSALSRSLQELWQAGINLPSAASENALEQSIFLQQQLQSLLSYSDKLQSTLASRQKLTSYEFCSEIFKNYSPKETIVFIGLTRQSKDFYQFLAKFVNSLSAVFILPPIDIWQLPHLNIDSQELLNFLNVDIDRVQPLSESSKIPRLYLKDFINVPSVAELAPKPSLDHISLIEVESEIEESNLIFLIIKDFIDKNPKSSVAVLSPNLSVTKLLINNLKRYQIDIANFLGQSFKSTKLGQFVICVAELIIECNNIEKLLICIKHPFVICQNSIEIEFIIREAKFIYNLEQIDAHIKQYDNINLQNWWHNLYQAIKSIAALLQEDCHDFTSLLRANLQAAELIYPDIWRIDDCSGINFLRELLESSNYIGSIKKAQYAAFIKEIFKKTKINNNQQVRQVSLMMPESSLYLNFDLMILSDMNENSWPNLNNQDTWLANNLRKALHLSTKNDELNRKIYDFYLMLCNKQVVITRSKKVNNKQTSPSKFLQKLLVLEGKYDTSALKNKDHYLYFLRQCFSICPSNPKQIEFSVPGNSFPPKASATNIELLIRNPYGFFAKNILKLYPLNQVNLESMNAEFGKMLHSVISIYNSQDDKSRQLFLKIARQELQKLSDNEFITKLWWPKIYSIAKSYVEFERKRRASVRQIYSEVYGEMYLDFHERKVKILAIADEIIINKDGTAQILDYKTGSIPSVKDVLSGASPQLIIEGLILQQGGFKGLSSITPDKITFVKLANSEPYITENFIDSIDFAKHYNAMKELIKYYLKEQVNYSVTPFLDLAPKYDNYKHLGRKI